MQIKILPAARERLLGILSILHESMDLPNRLADDL